MEVTYTNTRIIAYFKVLEAVNRPQPLSSQLQVFGEGLSGEVFTGTPVPRFAAGHAASAGHR